MLRLRTFLVPLATSTAIMIAAGCGSAPTAPTSPEPPANATGAVIAGLVVGQDGSPSSGLTVSVAGRDRSAVVADDGTFQIADVPAGSVQLEFRSQSVNASAALSPVASRQFVEVRVQVSPTAAVILEEVRSEKVVLCHRSEDGNYHRIDVSVHAEPAHREHGDGAPGEQHRDDPNKMFNENCELVGPSVDLEKLTNDVDADEAPGPSITVGSTVTWKYVVTNNGTVQLSGIQVSDDQSVVVTCPQTSLAPGASMTCTGTGVVTKEGQYRNVGKAVADWSANGRSGKVEDTDPSHYFGISPLEFEKLTNGEDADHPTGPRILVGDPVLWEYIVTNIGTVNLTGISVSDDQGVAVTCSGAVLTPGASMTCTANGTAVAGQYRNLGTVTANWANGGVSGSVTAEDPSHYLGVTEEEGPKVTLCHRTGAGFYVLINVGIAAEPAHLQHGDGKPGEAVPGQPTGRFTQTCGVQ